jgi:hypothetical protein
MKIAKQVIDGKKAKELFLEKCTADFLLKNPSEEVKEVFQN